MSLFARLPRSGAIVAVLRALLNGLMPGSSLRRRSHAAHRRRWAPVRVPERMVYPKH